MNHKIVPVVILFILIYTIANATIINVPADQPTIQQGIDVSVDSDTVLVQPDTYVENINYNGKNITVASLFLTTQDTTYISQTIIDGNQIGSVVTFENGEDTTAILIGFTITNGHGEYYPESFGGGITCKSNSNPTLENLLITDNFGYDGGGIHCSESSPILISIMITNNVGPGIYCISNSSPILENVTISNNNASYGGGICCRYSSSPILNNVIISNNFADFWGGGIYCHNYCNPILENVSIINNISDWYGGGIFCRETSTLNLENVLISENEADNDGGGISCSFGSELNFENVTISYNSVNNAGGGIAINSSSPTLSNVIISHNTALEYGGGLSCTHNSNPILENVSIYENCSNGYGDGIYCNNSSPSLVNVTITGNSSGDGGGGICCRANSSPSLVNCIMWNDIPQEVYFYEENDPNSITISYSDIQGGEAGIVTNNNGTVYWLEGNIDEDPLFVGTGEHPYSLLEDSPCIDAGTPDTTGLFLPPWDIIGNMRIWDGDGNGSAIIDMGVYEYGAPPYVDVDDNVIVQTPEVFLHQNYPNPFNPETTISFSVTQTSSFVTLNVYNTKGQKVKTLVNEILLVGKHSAIWNGRDSNGNRVGSGIYFYRFTAGNYHTTKKCVILK
ncbi:MAG: right-handed parallel beta-helix repeat-containing protein [Candidatus Cloacimonetes bacterium]|nr:right-handed parallel beta-helix repeat-containing protein [Candidatus Cloacimonadota bacterium]